MKIDGRCFMTNWRVLDHHTLVASKIGGDKGIYTDVICYMFKTREQ
jgi:hypothetical protein